MKILVTGSNGQVGSELRCIATQFPQFDCHFVSKTELDITDNESIIQLFKIELWTENYFWANIRLLYNSLAECIKEASD